MHELPAKKKEQMLAPTKDAPKCWRAHGNVPDAADAPSRRWLQSCHPAPPQVTSPAQVFQVFQKSGGGHTGSQRHSAQGFCVWWGTKVRGCHHTGVGPTLFLLFFFCCCRFRHFFLCVFNTPASPPGVSESLLRRKREAASPPLAARRVQASALAARYGMQISSCTCEQA